MCSEALLFAHLSAVWAPTWWGELADPSLEGAAQVGCTTDLGSILPNHHSEVSSVFCKPWPHEAVEFYLQAERTASRSPQPSAVLLEDAGSA